MHESLHKIEAALVVRDPGTARSVEAYDGLRKQVNAAMRHRRVHLVQLTQIVKALDAGADAQGLRAMVEEWLAQAGLEQWNEPEPVHFFRVLDGPAERYEVEEPAWVDAQGDEPILVAAGLLRAAELRTGNKETPGTTVGESSVVEPAEPSNVGDPAAADASRETQPGATVDGTGESRPQHGETTTPATPPAEDVQEVSR
jgi:hypothetical protein